jgi:Ser/Thr protein kinase RdoA (MazF antagonist)
VIYLTPITIAKSLLAPKKGAFNFSELEHVANIFDIGKLISYAESSKGESTSTCKIKSDKGDFFLKRSNDSDQRIEQSIPVLNFLNDKGVSVPRPIFTVDGAGTCKKGQFEYAIFEFQKGICLSDYVVDHKRLAISCRYIAEEIAKYHGAITSYTGEIADSGDSHPWFLSLLRNIDRNTSNEKVDAKIKAFVQTQLPRVINEYEEFRDLYQRIENESVKTIIHGDLSIDNVIFLEPTNPVVLDFDLIRKGPVNWDLASAISSFCCRYDRLTQRKQIDPALVEIFLSKYKEFHSLDPNDEKVIPTIIYFQQLQNIIMIFDDVTNKAIDCSFTQSIYLYIFLKIRWKSLGYFKGWLLKNSVSF